MLYIFDMVKLFHRLVLTSLKALSMADHKLPPLHGARVCFVGFSAEETDHMRDVLTENGGIPVQTDDPSCTHVVMENGKTHLTAQLSDIPTTIPLSYNNNTSYNLQNTENQVATTNLSFDNQFDYTMDQIGQNSPLEPISEEIFTSEHQQKFIENILSNSSIESPLKRKRDSDSDQSFVEPMRLRMTTSPRIMRNIKKRRLSITPRIMEMLKTPMALFTPKRAPSIEDPDDSNSLNSFNLSPTESLESLSISRNYCSTPICNKTQTSVVKAAKEKIFSRKKSKSLRNKKKKNKAAKNKEKNLEPINLYSEYSGPNIIESNLKTKFKPQIDLNITDLDVIAHDRTEDELCTPTMTKAQILTPQTVPRIMVTNNNDAANLNTKVVKKLNLSKRHSICIVESTDRRVLLHSSTSSKSSKSRRSSSLSPPPSSNPSEQSDGTQSQRWRLHHPNHLVVDESAVAERPEITSRALLVKAEWFWASVQNAACIDEKDYMFDDYLESILSPTRRESRSLATPNGAPGGSASGRRKRKRLHGTLGSLVRGTSLSGPGGPESPGLHKRRSSISDAGLLSVSSSFLDCTASPDKSLLDEPEGASGDATTVRKTLSPRQQVFMELVQTESNYVNILNTIMTMFKNHLEKTLLDNEEEALLNNTELKIIFGNLPPIYETHSKMLEELRWASAHWSEDTSIGNIFLKYSADLIKAYPPFVNFFETMKEALIQCDQTKPRFHAFLKVCQTRPECGRQSLQELLIRPVQRLPSISLLLSDIIKHTPKANPDHSALEKALTSIREVITIINEDKRKTEGMVVMFNIHDQIDKCPADLVSSHRNFVTRCEVQQLSDGLSGRGDTLVFFLFTDTLEVCKKPKPKKGSGNSLKSPVTVNGLPPIKSSSSTTNKLPYKHVRLIHLSTIRKVIDIRETEDFHNGFALVCRNNLELNKNNQELKEDLYYFTVLEDEINKTNFLRTLCRQMANTVCQADADSFLACLDAHQLNIKSMDGASGTLSKANLYKLAEKTRMKVGRAFSFNKTPLKRAVSTMMSPFGSNANLTPSSQLAQMRLASCNNINELGGGNAGSPSSTDTLVAPLSVQPTRKAKYSSLNIAALRRL
ncbi:protein ECT2 isoform X2 [Chrysoperla carnea]|uniref:protein ECT2 isoform X2 n=1 Tax=Chrysoperla carnea TaxID=189513 RepID=UPI001D09943E|nr:protein ECT2 isoform X2 [Chrysoperla carnea]